MALPKAAKSVHSTRYRLLLERLRAARREAGLTQAQVAAKLGQPQSFISKSESGERRLDIVEMERLARLYGKPRVFFLGERVVTAVRSRSKGQRRAAQRDQGKG